MHDEFKSLDQRTFLAIAAAGAGTLALTGSVPTTGPATRQRSRPNIVFIAADDLGHRDLSGYGRADCRTPILD